MGDNSALSATIDGDKCGCSVSTVPQSTVTSLLCLPRSTVIKAVTVPPSTVTSALCVRL
ncbi:hypothetical protein [Nostoc sp. JL33]|uniref:hypothetical protein n=1 Tax=Nostoc sp. JL33 TaxID=2815396 RepID=UPI0025D186CA|nr:hypothetical protein [Nostoc sp. JL33]MBN3869787.1 hypothetical protein [Nostoc sp. JL33]